jgi:carbon starvation protein
MSWLVAVTFTAAWQKIFSPVPAIGFLAQAAKLEAALQAGTVAAAAVPATQTLVFNARLDAAICGLLMVLVGVILADSLRVWSGLLSGGRVAEIREAPFVPSRLSAEEL